MKYRVSFEEVVCSEVDVEASSYEEAVYAAECTKPTKVATNMLATWVGETEKIQETGEYEYQVIGPCPRCQTPIVSRDIPGQPWAYGSGRDQEGLVCFKCLTTSEKNEVASH